MSHVWFVRSGIRKKLIIVSISSRNMKRNKKQTPSLWAQSGITGNVWTGSNSRICRVIFYFFQRVSLLFLSSSLILFITPPSLTYSCPPHTGFFCFFRKTHIKHFVSQKLVHPPGSTDYVKWDKFDYVCWRSVKMGNTEYVTRQPGRLTYSLMVSHST